MELLVFFVVLGIMAGGFALWRYLQHEQAERIRDRARLKVVEGQLATFRALLWLDVSEHLTRRQMTRLHDANGHDGSGRWSS